MVKIVKDIDFIDECDQYDVVLVGTSVYCMLTNGFQSKLRIKYPWISEYNTEGYGDMRKLGKRKTAHVEGSPVISLMFICKYPHSKRVFLDYGALENCLQTAMSEFKGKKIGMTLVGCSRFDGNGDRDTVLSMIERLSNGNDVTVYDYQQLRKRDEAMERVLKPMLKYEKTDRRKFKQLWSKRKEIMNKFYLEY